MVLSSCYDEEKSQIVPDSLPEDKGPSDRIEGWELISKEARLFEKIQFLNDGEQALGLLSNGEVFVSNDSCQTWTKLPSDSAKGLDFSSTRSHSIGTATFHLVIYSTSALIIRNLNNQVDSVTVPALSYTGNWTKPWSRDGYNFYLADENTCYYVDGTGLYKVNITTKAIQKLYSTLKFDYSNHLYVDENENALVSFNGDRSYGVMLVQSDTFFMDLQKWYYKGNPYPKGLLINQMKALFDKQWLYVFSSDKYIWRRRL